MIWSQRSLKALEGVDLHLAVVVSCGVFDFERKHDEVVVVTSGRRTPQEQDALFAKGISPLAGARSLHTRGTAVDLAIVDGSRMVSDLSLYGALNERIQLYAEFFGIGVIWGGDWGSRDGCHWQLAA